MKGLLERLFRSEEWESAGKGWQGIRTELMLEGWSRSRPLVVLRRQIRNDLALTQPDPAAPKQLSLGLAEIVDQGVLYEYVVLVSSLDEEVATIAQHYRDRADAENNFDELKNQWSWSGFTTQDLLRCQVLARIGRWCTTGGRCLRGWGDPRQAWRGDHNPSAAAARHCPADAPRPPNHGNDYQLAREGAADEGGFAAGERLSAMGASNCGAVDPSPTLATDSELDFPPISPRQSPRRPLVCHRCPLATAVFRITSAGKRA